MQIEVSVPVGRSTISYGNGLDCLRDIILLGGSVRASQLAARIGRPLFELPATQGRTVLDLWHDEATSLARRLGAHAQAMRVRVMVDRTAAVQDRSICANGRVALQVERDPLEYRGTGGVLRDAAAAYADDDYLLVLNAAQVPVEPLTELTEALAATGEGAGGAGGDVCLVSHRDGTPSGTFLVRCGALRQLPPAGFVDMKEQALPAIARRHRVMVLHREAPAMLPVRTLSDYCLALRRYHQKSSESPASTSASTSATCASTSPDPFAEDWEPVFRIVEDGATVEASARLHDSVVLRGGRVGAGATLVRSVVCAGGVVGAGEVVVDEIVAPSGDSRRRRAGRGGR